MKVHKHKDLIIAWAKGAVIQLQTKPEGTWVDIENNYPSWIEETVYRIKPREFKIGHWYPVKSGNYYMVLLCTNGDTFKRCALSDESTLEVNTSITYKADNLNWIGESLGELSFGEDE